MLNLGRIWWNWQTRYFEVVVGQPVQVQVLLCAPNKTEEKRAEGKSERAEAPYQAASPDKYDNNADEQ
jgi:hypothetical protein